MWCVEEVFAVVMERKEEETKELDSCKYGAQQSRDADSLRKTRGAMEARAIGSPNDV